MCLFVIRMVAWHWPLPLTLTTRWLSTQNSHILVNVSGRLSPNECDLLSCSRPTGYIATLRNSLRLVVSFPLSLPGNCKSRDIKQTNVSVNDCWALPESKLHAMHNHPSLSKRCFSKWFVAVLSISCSLVVLTIHQNSEQLQISTPQELRYIYFYFHFIEIFFFKCILCLKL